MLAENSNFKRSSSQGAEQYIFDWYAYVPGIWLQVAIWLLRGETPSTLSASRPNMRRVSWSGPP